MARAREEINFKPKKLSAVTVSAVDTFHTPATPYVDPSIIALASSLSSIVPSLAKYSVVKDEETKEVAKGEAAVAFRKNNMASFREAVKKGLIPQGANPYFVEAYVQQELIQKAKQFKDELYAAWKNEGIVNNTDPQVFDKFFAEKSRLFRDKHKLDSYDSADVATAFIPNVEAARSNLFERHINERMDLISSENQKLLKDNTVGAIENNIDDEGTFDAQGLGEDLTKVATDLIAKGMNGSKVNEILIDTITEQAQDLEDDTILEVLAEIKTATGTLADTAYAKEKVDDAETNILTKELRKENYNYTQYERNLKKMRETTVSLAIKSIQENGVENFDIEKFLKDNDIIDPVSTSSIYSLTNTIINSEANIKDDEKYITDILIKMNNNINDIDLMDSILSGIGTKYSVSRGLQLFNDYQRKRDTSDHYFLNSSGYKNLISSIRTAIKKESIFTEEIAMAEIAVWELDDFAIRWIIDNPQGSKQEFNRAARQEWTDILKVFVGARNFGEVETFQEDLGNEVLIDNSESKVEEQGSSTEEVNVFSKEYKEGFENVSKLENKKALRASLIEEVKSFQVELADNKSKIEKLENSPKKNKTAFNALMQPLVQEKTRLTAEFANVKNQLEKLK